MRKKKNIDEKDIPKALQKKRKQENEKTRLPKKKKKSLKKKIIILLVVIFIVFLIWGFIRIHIWKSLAQEMLLNTPSQIIDTNGNTIAKVGSEKIKEPVEFSKIPDKLKKAYISIEDQRYYSHHGVDIKRTVSAIGSYIIHFGSSSFGGSTITQQLVKNMTGDDSNSIQRKVTEWVKAFSLETSMSKDEIIGTYLNIIYVGPNVYGVQAGSKYYFDKDVADLSLAECAFLAGINNSPNSYNPFGDKDKTEKITNRTKTVLNKMLELKNISQDEYNQAITEVENGFNFNQGNLEPESDGVYSYHTDALISELIHTISEQKHISSSFATNFLNMAGLKIYSTQNSEIQSQMENEFEKRKYILKSNNDENTTSQAAMVIIDHKTGNVVRMRWRFRRKNKGSFFK